MESPANGLCSQLWSQIKEDFSIFSCPPYWNLVELIKLLYVSTKLSLFLHLTTEVSLSSYPLDNDVRLIFIFFFRTVLCLATHIPVSNLIV